MSCSTQALHYAAGGLSACFIAGRPFYWNQLLCDTLIFGGHNVIQRLYRPTGEVA